jgi:hypothetical protein
MKSERSSERAEQFRRQRAIGLVTLRLVSREGDAFVVKTPFLREPRPSARVWKEAGRIRCDCDELATGRRKDPKYRCTHILAVKYALETNQVYEPKPERAQAPETPDLVELARKALARHAANMPTPGTEPTAPDADELTPELDELAQRTTLKQIMEALDHVAPKWGHRINQVRRTAHRTLSVTVTLTVGGVARQGTGEGSAAGDIGLRRAEAEAMKRAALKFKRVAEAVTTNTPDPPSPGEAGTKKPLPFKFRGSPESKTIRNMMTPTQRRTLESIAARSNSTAEEECQAIFRCTLNNISKRAATALITFLEGQPGQDSGARLKKAS